MPDLSRLVEPVSADAPCGPDLGYDAAFLELERIAAGTPELRMGWSTRAAVPPDWPAVAVRATALLARSKDWRTALLYARAAMHLEGWKGLEGGLALLLALEARFGADVHPRADDHNRAGWWADDEPDAPDAERMPGAGHPLLADLRSRRIGRPGATLTLGELEALQKQRVVGWADGIDGAGVLGPLRLELLDNPGLLPSLGATQAILQDLSTALDRRLFLHRPHLALTRMQECLARLAHALRWADGIGDDEIHGFLTMPPFEAPPVSSPPVPQHELETRPRSPLRAPSSAFDLAMLAAPVEGDAPCGPDLEYDNDFLELVQLQAGVLERFDGGQTIPAQPPDWPAVMRLAVGLLGRTKDLRLALILARAAANGDGLRGAASGLALIARLLSPLYWDGVHPVLDVDDDDDPTMRLNALAALSAHDGLLGDLRALEVGSATDVLQAGEIERVLADAKRTTPELGAPALRLAVDAIAAQLDLEPMFTQWLQDARATLREIASTLSDRVGLFHGGDCVGPLESFLGGLDQAVQAAQGGGASPSPVSVSASVEDDAADALPSTQPDAPPTVECIPSPLPRLAAADAERAGVLLDRMRSRLDAAATADLR